MLLFRIQNMSRPSPLFAQALQLFSRGAYPQAINLLQQVVAAQPAQLEPRLQLAKACLDWVSIKAGVPLTEIEPDELEGEAAHYLQLAASQLQTLSKSHPASPHVQQLLAMLHLVYSRHEEAYSCLKRAMAKEPRNPDLLYNMGYVLIELERCAEAEVQLNRLVTLYPAHGMGWQMLGQAKRYLGRPEEALKDYRKANSLLPALFEPYGAMSSALRDLARYAEAKDALQAGLARHPQNRNLNFSLALLALANEDWTTGWRYYFTRAEMKQTMPIPEGYVFPIEKGQTVRIHFDQGLGDELCFLRFIPKLAAMGVNIQYTTSRKLLPLLEGMPWFSELKAADQAKTKSTDLDLLVGELPYITGMRATSDVPPSLQLPLDAGRVNALRTELSTFGPPPYLGVTWQGGRSKAESEKQMELGKAKKRSKEKGGWEHALYKEIPPDLLGGLARHWPGTVIVIQRVPEADDMALFSKALGRPCLDWSKTNDDLRDALAGLSLLDEYVGVSNTNMHLMAGIGKTARVLVPYPADWRWMDKGKASPWFPGFKVYRQNQVGDWDSALQELADDLKAQWGVA
jgi:tetratricopeptide (TPR) repeat protein